MKTLPPELVQGVEMLRQEVRQFVTLPDAYYGVTWKGLLFYILRCYPIQPSIEDREDYFSYLLADCREGIFILRQHFSGGTARNWFLETRILAMDKTRLTFERIRECLEENPDVLEDICGEPHSADEYYQHY